MAITHCKFDGSDNFLTAYHDMAQADIDAANQTLIDDGSTDHIEPVTSDPHDFVEPVWDPVAGDMVEGADQPTVDADLAAYKEESKERLDEHASIRFQELLGGNDYVRWAHLVKGLEAADHNAAVTGDPVGNNPPAYRNDGADAKEHPIVEAEATARGITKDDMAASIVAWQNTQWDALAQIEAIRSPAKDQIDADLDRAAVDATLSQAITDLDNITITPPS